MSQKPKTLSPEQLGEIEARFAESAAYRASEGYQSGHPAFVALPAEALAGLLKDAGQPIAAGPDCPAVVRAKSEAMSAERAWMNERIRAAAEGLGITLKRIL